MVNASKPSQARCSRVLLAFGETVGPRHCKHPATHPVIAGGAPEYCASHAIEARELERVRRASGGIVGLAPLAEDAPEAPLVPRPPKPSASLTYGPGGSHVDPGGDPVGAWDHRHGLPSAPPWRMAVGLVSFTDRERTCLTVAAQEVGMVRHELLRILIFVGAVKLAELAELVDANPSLEAELRAAVGLPRHASIQAWAAALRASGLLSAPRK